MDVNESLARMAEIQEQMRDKEREFAEMPTKELRDELRQLQAEYDSIEALLSAVAEAVGC